MKELGFGITPSVTMLVPSSIGVSRTSGLYSLIPFRPLRPVAPRPLVPYSSFRRFGNVFLLTCEFNSLLVVDLKLDGADIDLGVRPDTEAEFFIIQDLRREIVVCWLIQDLSHNVGDVDGEGILDVESSDAQGHEWDNLLAIGWWKVHLKSLRREMSADGGVRVRGGVHGEGESLIGGISDGDGINLKGRVIHAVLCNLWNSTEDSTFF